MSTRWYPLYQKGGPQLRIFLPNFWLKLVKPVHEQQPNVVQFMCSMEMTKHDVRNYLEKIYNIKIVDVRTRIGLGRIYQDTGRGYVKKDDDIKYAYVTLPKEEKFEFPNLFPEEDKEKLKRDEEKAMEETKKNFKNFLEKNKERPNMPGWYSL